MMHKHKAPNMPSNFHVSRKIPKRVEVVGLGVICKVLIKATLSPSPRK